MLSQSLPIVLIAAALSATASAKSLDQGTRLSRLPVCPDQKAFEVPKDLLGTYKGVKTGVIVRITERGIESIDMDEERECRLTVEMDVPNYISNFINKRNNDIQKAAQDGSLKDHPELDPKDYNKGPSAEEIAEFRKNDYRVCVFSMRRSDATLESFFKRGNACSITRAGSVKSDLDVTVIDRDNGSSHMRDNWWFRVRRHGGHIQFSQEYHFFERGFPHSLGGEPLDRWQDLERL